jgi:hypothetical protein
METLGSSEAFANICHTTWRHIPEYNNIHTHRREILRSHIFSFQCIPIVTTTHGSPFSCSVTDGDTFRLGDIAYQNTAQQLSTAGADAVNTLSLICMHTVIL